MSKHIVVDEENITGRHGLNSFDNLFDGAETKFTTPELAYRTVLTVMGAATGRFHDVAEGIPLALEKIKRRSRQAMEVMELIRLIFLFQTTIEKVREKPFYDSFRFPDDY
jgi:hypothetical protein